MEIRHEFFQKHINNINIEIIEHAHYYGNSSSWHYYNMSSPFNRLYFTLGGDAYIENNEERIELTPGFVYIVPMYTHYNFMCKSQMEQFYIHFRANIFHDIDFFSSVKNCISLPMELSEQVNFSKICSSNKVEDIFKIKAMLFSLLAEFISKLPEFPLKNIENAYKYRALNQFIRDSCNFKLTTREIAMHLGLTESALNRNYKADTGVTLKSHIDSYILEVAKEKLILTDMSVKEIAFTLGFADEFYFSRFFRRHTDYSPRQYRKNNKLIAK